MKELNIEIAVKIYDYEELDAADRELMDAAREATNRSYAPYSHFSVGAAARLANGIVVTGTNQENAAYPSGLCAERTTLFYANSQHPDQAVTTLAIAARNEHNEFLESPIPPCGACRQVMLETEKRFKLKQLKLDNQTKLTDLQMKIKVSAMKLDRMKVELRNEQYLDSLGSGTTDKVRQAELSYNVAQLEYEQLQQQYANEKEVLAAEYQVQELDFSMFQKTLAETKRTLDDAQVRSPRKAILTYINNQIGAQVPEGSQIAVISDLSHFKVEGEIADTYGDRVAAGGKAIVKIGSEKLEGSVSSVTPLSKNGVISFTVQLNEDNNRRLRSGLKTDVYVMNAVSSQSVSARNTTPV